MPLSCLKARMSNRAWVASSCEVFLRRPPCCPVERSVASGAFSAARSTLAMSLGERASCSLLFFVFLGFAGRFSPAGGAPVSSPSSDTSMSTW